VAGEDADGWADMEAVCRLSGLHERTIRRWAKAGKVRKRGLLYNVRDVSQSVKAANPQTEEVSA
jgi:predicted site-specific integrase-resolvase